MARAELMRRRGSNALPSGITPQLAQEELKRRGIVKEPEEESFINSSKRSLARGARNALVGTLDNLDFLATPVREGINLGARGLEKLGLIEEGKYKLKPLGGEVAKGIDTLTGGYTAPRNDKERTQEAMGRALIGLPVGFGMGMAAQGLKATKYLPNVIPAIGNFLKGSNVMTPTNIASTAATSGLVQSSLNENPEDVVGAFGKGIAGGMAIPAVAGILSTLTGKGRQAAAARTGELLKVNPQSVETFEKAGITPMLADVSTGKIPKLITSKLEHLPGSAEPIRKAKDLQKAQILEGLGQGETGRDLSKSAIGRLGVKGTKEYQKGRQHGFNEGFKKVEEDIGKLADDSITFENTNKYFDDVLKNIKTTSQIQRFKKSPLGKLYTDLYESAKLNEGKLPYHDVKDRLDEINDAITTRGLIGKVSQGKLKQFASHLSKDIEQSLEPKFKELGKDSYKNWKKIRKEYASYAQEEIPKLNELYKKDKNGAIDAFMDILQNQKKGGEKAKIALQGLSQKEQIDFMDGINKQLGAKSDGSFSPLVWVRKYKGLEPESQKILLSPLNESSQKKVKYIADSIDHLKSTLEEANTSKTAYHAALGAVGGYGLKGIGDLFLTGNPIPLAKVASGLFLNNLASEQLLTNPKFINWMYKGMKAKDLEHFGRNLDRVPKVGKFTQSLVRSAQTFQNDLNRAKEEEKNKGK